MRRTSVSLDTAQMKALKRLAARERSSLPELMRRAITAYLAEQASGSDAWGQRFDRLVAPAQSRIPADVTTGEIEADITAARAEVRRVRRSAPAATASARSR
jgi:hypothetical protein